MLKSLSIKNYAIIDKLNIEFDDGFMCFTGETGAGKSIIVGALTFLLRGRSDTSIIKSGRDKAIVEGVFEIKDKEIISILLNKELNTCVKPRDNNGYNKFFSGKNSDKWRFPLFNPCPSQKTY